MRALAYAERKGLFDLIGQLIAGIIPRYRKLAESGQIELSTTPHYHPLAPLLLDLHSAQGSHAGWPVCRNRRAIPAGRIAR